MADVQTLSDISNLKNSKILVNVEDAIRDVLVVSYEFDSKLFQGVLLDSTKRYVANCNGSKGSFPSIFCLTSIITEFSCLFSL